ncbi:hypothetical protein RQP46_002264 [Phenoliferia psychrophenolica]
MPITTSAEIIAIYTPLKAQSIGALFIAFIISYFLFGLVAVNAWRYFTTFTKDSIYVKATVGLICLLAALICAFDGSWGYRLFVINYGDLEQMMGMTWEFAADNFLMGAIPLINQCFYAWRIYFISARTNWWTPVGIVLMSLAQFGTTTWACATTVHMTTLLEFMNDLPAPLGFELMEKLICNIYPLSVISSLTARNSPVLPSSFDPKSASRQGTNGIHVDISEDRCEAFGRGTGSRSGGGALEPVNIQLTSLGDEKDKSQATVDV